MTEALVAGLSLAILIGIVVLVRRWAGRDSAPSRRFAPPPVSSEAIEVTHEHRALYREWWAIAVAIAADYEEDWRPDVVEFEDLRIFVDPLARRPAAYFHPSRSVVVHPYLATAKYTFIHEFGHPLIGDDEHPYFRDPRTVNPEA